MSKKWTKKGTGELEGEDGPTYDKSFLLGYAAAAKKVAEEEQPSLAREVSLTARADLGAKELGSVDRKQQRSYLKAKAARRSNSGLGDDDEQDMVGRSISLLSATTPSVAASSSMADPAMMAYLQSMYAMSQMAAYGAIAAGYTTVMLRNIPNRYTREMLVKRLDESYKGQYDFVYLPIDFESTCNVGYVFINFRTPYSAATFLAEFHNAETKKVLPGFSSKKVCEVSYARVQGLEANIDNLRDEKFIEKLAEKPEWQPLFLDAAGGVVPFDRMMSGKKAKGGKTPKGGGGGTSSTPLAGALGFSPFGGPMLPPMTATPSMSSTTFSTVLPAASGVTMLAVRGVPLTLKRSELVEFLNDNVAKQFDFVFMPPDANFKGNKGVFFVNFKEKEKTDAFCKAFHEKKVTDVPKFVPVEGGFEKLLVEPAKVAIVQANILRTQAPEETGADRSQWQPLIFDTKGKSSEFPAIASEGKRKGDKTPTPSTTKERWGDRTPTPLAGSMAMGHMGSMGPFGTPMMTAPPSNTSPTFASVLPSASGETMLAVRGVPLILTRPELVEFLKANVAKQFDFVFMPPDVNFVSNKGIFFINFKDKEKTDEFIKAYHEKKVVDVKQFTPVEGGFEKLLVEPAKIAIVQANIIRAQAASPPEEQGVDRSKWQPLLFGADGESSTFPTITSEGKKKGDKTPTPKAGGVTPLGGAMGSFMMPGPFGPMLPPMMKSTPSGVNSIPSTPFSNIMPSASGETMLFVRGAPLTLDRSELVELLNEKFAKSFDFVFLPPDVKFSGNKGIFFVNFRVKEKIDDFRKAFQDKKVTECFPKFVPIEGDEEKFCSVEPAKVDIVESIINRLQTSAPAKQGVDRTKWQPLLFSPDGESLTFPLIASPGARQSKSAKTTKSTPSSATPKEDAQSPSKTPAAESAAAPDAAVEGGDAAPAPKVKRENSKGGKGKDKGKGKGGQAAIDMYSSFAAPYGFMPPPFGFMPGFPPYGMPGMPPMPPPSYISQPQNNKKGQGKAHAAGAGGDPSKLSSEGKKKSLMKQVDFYFSVDNLCKDVFLRQQMDQDGYCKLELIANFNLIKKKYMATVSDLAVACTGSTAVELSDDKTKVRLKDQEARQKWKL
jgi:hypothetical protein